MEPLPQGHAWLIPWLFPVVIIAVVICATLLPLWAFLIVGVIVLLLGVPLAWRTYSGARDGIELPDWLPGGRPGNR